MDKQIASLHMYEVECKDCGFMSCFVLVKFTDNTTLHRTGAGCFERPRRDKAAVQDWLRTTYNYEG